MKALAGFETMLQLSRQMVEAANANDWDRLLALEKAEAQLRVTLQAGTPADAPEISADDRQRLGELIREIQVEHGKVRAIVDPWLDNVRQLLSHQTRERSVRESYGLFTQAP